jgi:hypothetical protein
MEMIGFRVIGIGATVPQNQQKPEFIKKNSFCYNKIESKSRRHWFPFSKTLEYVPARCTQSFVKIRLLVFELYALMCFRAHSIAVVNPEAYGYNRAPLTCSVSQSHPEEKWERLLC